jgi:hypothetical protein
MGRSGGRSSSDTASVRAARGGLVQVAAGLLRGAASRGTSRCGACSCIGYACGAALAAATPASTPRAAALRLPSPSSMPAVCLALQSLPCAVAAIGNPAAPEPEPERQRQAQSEWTAADLPGFHGACSADDSADGGLGGDYKGCCGSDGLREMRGVEGVEPAVRRSVQLLVSVDGVLGGTGRCLHASLASMHPSAPGGETAEAGASGWMQTLEAVAVEVARDVDACVIQVNASRPARLPSCSTCPLVAVGLLGGHESAKQASPCAGSSSSSPLPVLLVASARASAHLCRARLELQRRGSKQSRQAACTHPGWPALKPPATRLIRGNGRGQTREELLGVYRALCASSRDSLLQVQRAHEQAVADLGRQSDLEIQRREASCAAQLADIKARLLQYVCSRCCSCA